MGKARVYCLRCLRPLPGATDLRTACTSCGYINFRPDRRRFWNQVPWVRALEHLLKVGVVVLTIAAAAVLLTLPDMFGRLAPWAAAAPLLFGAKLWQTVGLLTRRMPYAHPTLFWSAAIGLTGAALFMLGFGSLRTVGRFGLAIVGVWAIAWAYRTWKHDLLRRVAACE